MINEELVACIRAGAAPDAMEQLYRQNEGLIKKIANRYDAYAEFDDLVQEGFFGLYEAVQRYESGGDVPFISYAAWWIRRAMRRYILNCCRSVRIPEHTAGMIGKYRRFVSQYYQYYGKKPPRAAIQRFLGLDGKPLDRIEKADYMANIQSLDEPLKMDDELCLGDTVESGRDMESDVAEDIDQKTLKKELWGIVDNLEWQQRKVIRCRYQGDQSLKSVGKVMGISYERVRQIERDAMKKLRLTKNARRLYPFLNGNAYLSDQEEAMAYHGVGARRFNTTWTSATEKVALRRLERV